MLLCLVVHRSVVVGPRRCFTPNRDDPFIDEADLLGSYIGGLLQVHGGFVWRMRRLLLFRCGILRLHGTQGGALAFFEHSCNLRDGFLQLTFVLAWCVCYLIRALFSFPFARNA